MFDDELIEEEVGVVAQRCGADRGDELAEDDRAQGGLPALAIVCEHAAASAQLGVSVGAGRRHKRHIAFAPEQRDVRGLDRFGEHGIAIPCKHGVQRGRRMSVHGSSANVTRSASASWQGARAARIAGTRASER